MSDRSHVVAPLAGSGWLWAGPVAVVFTPGQGDPRPTELGRLVSEVAGGWELATRLLSAANDGSLERWPAFGIATTVPDGLIVVARGVEVFVGAAVHPQPAAGGIVLLTVGPQFVVRLGGGDWDPSHPTGDLVEGVARAGGVAFVARSPHPDQGLGVRAKGAGELTPEPLLSVGGRAAEAEDGDTVDIHSSPAADDSAPAGSGPLPPSSVLGLADEEAPGPPSVRLRSDSEPKPVTVTGVSCGRGHFNDPAARFCRVCGLGMHQTSRVETKGHRPPLGVLVWDHGGSDQIETDLVIGREPQNDPRVVSGEAEGLVPAGEVASLSRIHAEIRLDGWEANLIDRESSNGTFVWEPAQNRWRRLSSGEPVVLEAGMRLGFAERVAVFETGVPAF
jgi:hypothetical protein